VVFLSCRCVGASTQATQQFAPRVIVELASEKKAGPTCSNAKMGPTSHSHPKFAADSRATYRLEDDQRETKICREGLRFPPLVRSLLSQTEPAEDLVITGTAALILFNTSTSRDPVKIRILFRSRDPRVCCYSTVIVLLFKPSAFRSPFLS
jgi:hypothetical protein